MRWTMICGALREALAARDRHVLGSGSRTRSPSSSHCTTFQSIRSPIASHKSRPGEQRDEAVPPARQPGVR